MAPMLVWRGVLEHVLCVERMFSVHWCKLVQKVIILIRTVKKIESELCQVDCYGEGESSYPSWVWGDDCGDLRLLKRDMSREEPKAWGQQWSKGKVGQGRCLEGTMDVSDFYPHLQYQDNVIRLAKKFVGLFHKILQKNLKEIFVQPNTWEINLFSCNLF